MIEGPYTVESSTVYVGGGAYGNSSRILDERGSPVMSFARYEDAEALCAAFNLGALAIRRREVIVQHKKIPSPWEQPK